LAAIRSRFESKRWRIADRQWSEARHSRKVLGNSGLEAIFGLPAWDLAQCESRETEFGGEPSDRAEAIRVFAARYRNHLRSNSGHRLRTSLGFGSKPDESIHALLQFSTEHGQMLGVAVGCGRFLAVFHTVHLLSNFAPKTGYIWWNGLKQAKRLTARIDSKHAGLALTV
jgi:hypothetical protein